MGLIIWATLISSFNDIHDIATKTNNINFPIQTWFDKGYIKYFAWIEKMFHPATN